MTDTSNIISAIVLAAGLSQRMGAANKLLLPVSGKSLLHRTLDALVEADVDRIVVVLGHQSNKVREHIQPYRVQVVVNEHYAQGQKSSVTCGLRALGGKTGGNLGDKQSGVLICLGDQPMIEAKHIRHLVDAFSLSQSQSIVMPVHEGQRGNPVLISEHVRQRVLKNHANLGCRGYIDKHPELVNRLRVSDKAFITDIDTHEEYLAYMNVV